MQKIIIAPDSFKGTMSSRQICGIVAQAVRKHFPACEIDAIPVADGGEGSVDSFLACLSGEKITATVKNARMEDCASFFGLFGKTAVIETAACAGPPRNGGKTDPMTATTFGVGQLILSAAARGAERILVGLGGSVTNDGGCGAAAACGVRFLNGAGRPFVPTGGTLTEIAGIDASGQQPAAARITALCDVNNPMFGARGAAYVFAPQKGADPGQLPILDNGLRHLSQIIERDLGVDLSDLPGAGAAGAMGAGLAAFFKAEIRPGIETVLDTVDFNKRLHRADLVITGEGHFDSQSLGGKTVVGVAKRARAAGVPVVVIAGGADDLPEAYPLGVSAVFTINRQAEDYQVSRHKSEENLRLTAENICALIGAI